MQLARGISESEASQGADVLPGPASDSIPGFLWRAEATLAATLELEQAIQAIAAVAVPALADWCVVDLLDEGGGLRRVAVAHADPALAEVARTLSRYTLVLDREGPAALALQSGRAAQVEIGVAPDEEFVLRSSHDEAHAAAVRAMGLRSLLFAPLLARGRRLGLLTLGSTQEARRYDEAMLATACELAGRAALAVDTARLYGEARLARDAAEQAAHRHALLQEVTASFAQAFTLEEVAEAVVHKAVAALGARAGSLALLSEEGDEVLVVGAIGYSAELLARFGRMRLSDPTPLCDTVRSGEPLFLHAGEECSARYPHLSGDGALASVPLVSLGRTVGALGLSFDAAHRFDESERAFVSTVAGVCAQALERVRLFAAERAARQTAERAALRLARQQDLAMAFSRALTADEVAAALVQADLSPERDETVAVFLPAKDDTGLVLAASRRLPPSLLGLLAHVPFDSELPAARVWREGEALWVERSADFQRLAPRLVAAAGQGPRTLAVLPLAIRGRRLGVVTVAHPRANAFEPEERIFLETVVQQCAQSLERARLYEQERRSRQRLAVLAQASEVLASSLDYETTLQNIARVAMPTLADFGFFDIEEDDGQVRRIAHAHGDASLQALLETTSWSRSERTDLVLCALSAGRSGYHPQVDDAWMRHVAVGPGHLHLLRQLGFCSLITVPLEAQGRSFGALTLCYARSARHHSREDLALAEELARRAAAAVENARLFRRAQEAIHHRDNFLSIASHELNTPLTALTLQLQGLLRGAADPERTRRNADAARRQVGRLAKLVSELLDVSRVAAGKLVLEREPVDVALLAREVAARFSEELAKSGSPLTLSVPESLLLGADRLRLDQVLTNLLSNAIKYGQGRPVLVEVAEEPDWVRLVVEDQGIGIDEEAQARIFQRFERAVSVRHFGGFGLGLWIVRQVVEAHGGGIRLWSESGKGTRLTVRLPRGVQG